MFLGESVHTLDAKSRVVVPARFLPEFAQDVAGKRPATITRGFEGCLFLFPEDGFVKAMERMSTQAFLGEEQRRMQRLFFSNAHATPIDKAGRLLIPEKLRNLAGLELEKEVVLVGVADRAELWSHEAWQAFNAKHDAEFDKLDQVLLGEGEGAPPGA
ncbi:MAG: division/cell wall cluster transcriptional repressor MraZ [Planctomycetota bacterium]